jgi:dTDP-4-dehydrorhamnose reductase
MVFLGRDQLDLAELETIEPALTSTEPDVIINAAAYTAVDQAEDERDLAFAVNATGPGEAAPVAQALDVPFLHISTDYVFDGTKVGRYTEFDPVAPLGVYGASKEAGEQAVREATPRHAIYRTAWVYAPEGKNFVKTMLRLAADRDLLTVVGDQRGSPTSATDLAAFLLHAADACIANKDGAFGNFHVAGMGEASWAEFAELITGRGAELGLIDSAPTVKAITTAEYPTKAARPANSVLDCRKSQAVYGYSMKPWQAALDEALTEIKRLG